MLVLMVATAVTASGINGIHNGMPNRISMNVTVPKQTQGATFGEKVRSGLQVAGGAVASGENLVIECGSSACAVALPDGSGYRAELESMTLGPLDAAQGLSLRKGAAGAAVVGHALPGGSILSAAVSSVSNLGGKGGGAAAAAYPATGRSAAPRALASRVREDGGIDITEPLADGAYVLTLVVEQAASGLKDTLKTQVRTATVPHRIRMRLVFSAADGALRARQDSGENSIAAMN
ncbi:MAG: hypothetical protein KGL25_00195 [Gammaproteobacteria bacterium]|nr:hypothetical protein [Gammaproteobacteria bacterium]